MTRGHQMFSSVPALDEAVVTQKRNKTPTNVAENVSLSSLFIDHKVCNVNCTAV